MAAASKPSPTSRRHWASYVVNRRAMKRLGAVAVVLVVLGVYVDRTMLRMPGKSHAGPLPSLTEDERTLAARLRADVTALAVDIGPRNVFHPAALHAATDHLAGRFEQLGYAVDRQTFEARGVTCTNLAVEIAGTSVPDQIVVIGAHYDSVGDCPGANDNGTGVAATLALAERFAGKTVDRTLRFVLFANEEPPCFQSADMGSLHYARGCRANGDDVVAMISLETIGFYRDEKGTQKYPAPFGLLYPSEGNFIAFVGNVRSRKLVRTAVGRFRATTAFPSEGAALPGAIAGIGWSDHWAFWEADYPAIMVTDTAPFRFPHYHLASDLPDTIDYERMARVVVGIERVVEGLATR